MEGSEGRKGIELITNRSGERKRPKRGGRRTSIRVAAARRCGEERIKTMVR